MSFSVRYDRNKPMISDEEQALLKSCTVAVAGLGGLGGIAAEQLARLGFGRLILIDDDAVEESNLNRQLFALEETIGMPKTKAALERLNAVNAETVCDAHTVRLDSDNAVKLLSGAGVVIDALDNIESRRVLQNACNIIGIPLVYGAIDGWCGQVSFLEPHDDILDRLYPSEAFHDKRQVHGNPVFTAATVASIQVTQAVKWRLKKGGLLTRRVLYIDLLTQEFEVIQLTDNN